MVTFKEINDNSDVEKIVKKAGLSLAIIFSKEEQIKYKIKYGSKIRLNNAEVVFEEKTKNL